MQRTDSKTNLRIPSVSFVDVFPWKQFFESRSHTIIFWLLEQRTDIHRTCHLLIRLRAPATRRDEDEGRDSEVRRVMMGHVDISKRLEASVAEPEGSGAEPFVHCEVALARFPFQRGTCKVHYDDLRWERCGRIVQVNRAHVKQWMYISVGLADQSLSLKTQIGMHDGKGVHLYIIVL